MDALLHDLRYALRQIRKSPGFTAIIVLMLALGIGANTTLFSIVNAALLRPLPYPQPDRIISVSMMDSVRDRVVVDQRSFETWHQSARTFSAIAAYTPSGATLTGNGVAAERLSGADVSADFFRVFGAAPALGRSFLTDEVRPGAPRVVVLSNELWTRDFGADAGIIGRAITLDNHAYTVVGVMPSGFHYPGHAALWTPLALEPLSARNVYYYFVIGRLRAGTALSTARAELTALRERIGPALPEYLRGARVHAITLHERMYGDLRPALLVLLATVGCILLIGCANVANLLLARAAARRSGRAACGWFGNFWSKAWCSP